MIYQPDNALIQALQRNIKQWLRQSDWAQVNDALAELKQLDPLSVQTRGLELEYLLEKKEYQSAQQLSQQLLNLFPGSSRIHYLCAQLAYRQKQYAKALEAFDASNRLYPHWLNERYMGKTLTQTGNFDQAEPLLLRHANHHPECLLDLAWLYERKQQYAKARNKLEEYLKLDPEHHLARQQLQRIQVHKLSPAQLLAEVETLTEFGEEIPAELLSEYMSYQLTRGEGKALRLWLKEHVNSIAQENTLQPGWACYHKNAYDLAFALLVKNFAAQFENFKYRTALEISAERSGQLNELVEIYNQYAEQDERFYGRAKKLSKKIET